MSEKELTFKEFAEKENAAAPFEKFRRGIGAISDIVRNTKENLIRGAIFGALLSLSEEQLNKVKKEDSDETITVAEIIAAEVEKVLPTIQKERFISMLDIVTTGLTEDEEIRAELKKHELDLEKKDDLEYILQVFKTAIKFYGNKDYVIEKPDEKLPGPLQKMKSPEDIYRVFKTASGNLETPMMKKNVKQACALLRIAAVIDYINVEPQLAILGEAHIALQELLDKYFKSDGKKIKFRSRRQGDISPIIHRRIDREKEFESILAKLLRKPEESARSVMDGLGVTFLTGSKRDSLLLVYKLFFDPGTSIFPATNIEVGEGKNLLITKGTIEDALATQDEAENLVDQISINMELENEAKEALNDYDNTNSSEEYKDIIHIVVIMTIRLKNGERRMVPVEFQIKDVVANANIEQKAPHPTYKRKQKKPLRKRLFSNNLMTSFKKHREGLKRTPNSKS